MDNPSTIQKKQNQMKYLILILFIIIASSGFAQIDYTYYPKEKLEQDVDYVLEKLTNIHPVFSDNEEQNIWEQKSLKLKESLKDSMTQNEFYISLSSFLAGMNDGHSGVIMPYNQRIKYSKAGGTAFPFFVDIKDYSIYNRFYCGNDSTIFQGGEEILEINGINSSDMVREIQKIFGGKSLAIKQKAVASNFRFYIWMFYGFENDYELVFRDAEGQKKRITVPGVSSSDFKQNLKRMPKDNQEQFRLKLDKNGNTAILKIKSFGDLKGFCSFAKNAFTELEKNNIQNLIIDVRDNGGGRSVVVDSLMNYINDKGYSQYNKIETRISKELKERYKIKYPERMEWVNQFTDGELINQDPSISTPTKNELRFKGDLYLLTNSNSYSAAATFAGAFKELKLGTIVGEETGGTIEYYGDFWYLKTPNTEITFHISPKRFIQFGGSDFDGGVVPNYKVKDTENKIIDFTFELIEKQIAEKSK